MGNQIFISYRRTGGDTTAKLICETLKNRGFTVFYDFDTLKGGFFDTRIIGAIEGCNDMVLVLPPHALDRCANEGDWVRQEIRHALQHGKNIIPVFLDGFSFPTDLPDDIAEVTRFNGLHFSMEYFDAAIDKITEKLSPQTKAGRSLTLRPSNLRDLVRNVCSFGSCDFSSTSPADAYFSNVINRDRYNVIYFRLTTAPIKGQSSINVHMAIYNSKDQLVFEAPSTMPWEDNYSLVTLSWVIRDVSGAFVNADTYRAEFRVDDSNVYEYTFRITSSLEEEQSPTPPSAPQQELPKKTPYFKATLIHFLVLTLFWITFSASAAGEILIFVLLLAASVIVAVKFVQFMKKHFFRTWYGTILAFTLAFLVLGIYFFVTGIIAAGKKTLKL